MDGNNIFFTRRRLIKGVGAATGAGIIGGGSLLYASQPALAATSDITGDNLSLTANDDSVSEVRVSPQLTLDWSQFSSGISGFDITVSAAPSGGTVTEATALTGISDATSATVSTFTVANSGSLGDESGSATVNLAAIPLVANGALTTSDLPSGVADGASSTKTVDFEVSVTANSSSGGNNPNDTKSNSFDVTLTNDAGTATASGTVNTSGDTS